MNNYENLLKDNKTNFFYETINTFIKSKSENTLLEKLESIQNSTEPLTNTEYKILGALSYLLGLDFVSQTTKPHSVVLFNVNERFTVAGVTKNVVDKFLDVVSGVNVDRLEVPKENIINKINEKIPTEDAIKLSLLSSLIKELTLPVGFVLELNDISKQQIPTFKQLLTVNSIIYERADFTGSTANNLLVPLLQTQSWGKCIKEASSHFEMQKYSLIYFDSIISAKDFINGKPECKSWLFDENLIEELKTTETEVFNKIEELTEVEDNESEEIIEEVVLDNNIDVPQYAEYPGQYATPDEVDVFVQGFLNEILYTNMGGRVIEKPQDIFDAVNYMITNAEESDDETLAQFYTYIKSNQTNESRIDFDKVYDTMNFIAFKNELEDYLNNLRDEYREMLGEMLDELPPLVLNKIVTLVNNLIKKLTFSVDAQNKAYLIQQLVENQITTYKHLEQIQTIIESCYIQVKYAEDYEELYNFIKSNENIVKVFNNASKVNTAKYKLQAFSGLHDFFCRTNEEDSKLIIKNN